MKETKKEIVSHIMELKIWCKENGLIKEFAKCVENHGQQSYCSNELMEQTLMYKNKELLNTIRERVLEDVVYK